MSRVIFFESSGALEVLEGNNEDPATARYSRVEGRDSCTNVDLLTVPRSKMYKRAS